MKRFVPALLAIAAISGGGVRADFYTGLAAYERGDYDAARREWLPLAEAGDAETQYRIGRLYFHGQVGQDDAEAAKWYRLAAERGHAAAQNNLGLMVEQGRGVAADPAVAAQWYRRAADQGLPVAQANLARLYDRGIGVAEDPAKAGLWYERAASADHVAAQLVLARMYEEGRGVPQSEKKATKWYRRAAKNGSPDAQRALDEVGYRRFAEEAAAWAETAEVVAATPADEVAVIAAPVAERRETAPAPVPEPGDVRARAEGGDAEAQFALARMYATGETGDPDMDQAARWYLAAAEGGHAMAAYQVGFLYYRGRGVRGDLVQAYRWLAFAAERGVGDAERWLAEVGSKMSKKERAEAEALTSRERAGG